MKKHLIVVMNLLFCVSLCSAMNSEIDHGQKGSDASSVSESESELMSVHSRCERINATLDKAGHCCIEGTCWCCMISCCLLTTWIGYGIASGQIPLKSPDAWLPAPQIMEDEPSSSDPCAEDERYQRIVYRNGWDISTWDSRYNRYVEDMVECPHHEQKRYMSAMGYLVMRSLQEEKSQDEKNRADCIDSFGFLSSQEDKERECDARRLGVVELTRKMAKDKQC